MPHGQGRFQELGTLSKEEAWDAGGGRSKLARLKGLVCYAEVLVLQAVTLQRQGNEPG